jgi:beta-lactamase class A
VLRIWIAGCLPPTAWQEHSLNVNWGDPELKADLEAIERETDCTLCLTVRNLQTGDAVRYRGDWRCRTASVIKLPMLVHIAMAVAEGTLSWSDRLILTDAEKVGGSGVLTQLTAGLELTLRDLCVLMTIVSDNTATNMLIEHLGVPPINARMRSLGLPLTTLYRKSYTPDTEDSKPYGLGMTTPDEMADLLQMLAEVRAGSPEVSTEILKILAGQTLRDSIPRVLPEDWKYAGKTGGIDGVRNDVALVTAPDGAQFALALFCQELKDLQWTPDNAGLLALARVARRLLLSPGICS